MLDAVNKAGVKHACAYNYRFVPALRLAREMIERGELGQIYHFRAVYLQEWIMDPQFPMVWRLKKDIAGSGALGDLGAHIIDLARFLVGEPTAISGLTQTFIKERPTDDGGRDTVDVDDAFVSLVQFANGAIGTLEASRYGNGRKNHQRIEINGSKGSIVFDLERLNELEVHLRRQRTGRPCPGLPPGAGHRGRPPLLEVLVAPRPHHRLGAYLRPRVHPPAGRHRERHGGRALRC